MTDEKSGERRKTRGYHGGGVDSVISVDEVTRQAAAIAEDISLEQLDALAKSGKAKLQPGETMLVHAAGSGIGSTAILMAKAIGCNVITTVGDDAKMEKAKALGADVVWWSFSVSSLCSLLMAGLYYRFSKWGERKLLIPGGRPPRRPSPH